MSKSTFLTAEWQKLIMANYEVDPSILKPHLPYKTELDIFEGKCFVSLVGFLFQNTRVKGLKIPYHTHFEEVNLRFYVTFDDPEMGKKRGVVFISEIVPKPAIAWVANTVYHEAYSTAKMSHHWQTENDLLSIAYHWEKDEAYFMKVLADPVSIALEEGSEEQFIAEHYWGYNRVSAHHTTEYEVRHPSWEVYPVKTFDTNADFGRLYGEEFAHLNGQQPSSIFLAEGSKISVHAGKKIK